MPANKKLLAGVVDDDDDVNERGEYKESLSRIQSSSSISQDLTDADGRVGAHPVQTRDLDLSRPLCAYKSTNAKFKLCHLRPNGSEKKRCRSS